MSGERSCLRVLAILLWIIQNWCMQGSSQPDRQLLDAVRASGAAKAQAGETAARSQDFLYDPDGLPR